MKNKGKKTSILENSKYSTRKVGDENANKLNQKKEYVFDTVLRNPNFNLNTLGKPVFQSNNKFNYLSSNQQISHKGKKAVKNYFKQQKTPKSKLQKSFLNAVSIVKGQNYKESILKSKTKQNNLILDQNKIIETIYSINELHTQNNSSSNSCSSDEENEGAYIQFDSNRQSVSVVSINSLLKKKKSEKSSVKTDSIIMNNLSFIADNNNSLFSPILTNNEPRRKKNTLRANFLSQVNNRIIEECSPEIDKINNDKSLKKKLKDLSFSDCFKYNLDKKKINHRKKKSECLSSKYYLFNKQNYLLDSFTENKNFSLIENRRKKKLFFEHLFKKLHQKLKFCFKELREQQMIKKLINRQDNRTKLMIKNIPNKFTITQLVDLFQQDFKDKFNFVYLVIDPKTDCNQGYGFINLCRPEYKCEFLKKYHRTKWPGSKSGKVCELSYAKLQTPEKIDEVFMEKYFREWNKYWVDPKIILSKFPSLKNNLVNLESIRRTGKPYYMNYSGFYQNNGYPFGY